MDMKTKMAPTEFGEQLRNVRKEKGLTQAQLAKISGISRRMIVHYETHVKMPPLSKVKKLAEAIGVSADELIGITKPSKHKIPREQISPSIIKRVKIIEELPVHDRKVIFSLIKSLAEKNKLKGKL
jgi:transcriptional regulator with XRE-family HTH domain